MDDKMEIKNETSKPASSGFQIQWSQWQMLDSILPTGGFAHSFGLEAAVQARIVSSPNDLRTYIIHLLENTASLLLPFVYSASVSPHSQSWYKLDKMLDAVLTNDVGRKASISQGSALLRVASSVFSEIPSLKMMRDTCLHSGVVSFHHAPIFGLVCGLLGFETETSQSAYMFITIRDVISSATRLNLIGPLGAAVLQHETAFVAENLLEKWKNREAEDACQTAPLLDTVQGCHDGESLEHSSSIINVITSFTKIFLFSASSGTAACRLSMVGINLCLLEKGRKWESKDFPRNTFGILSVARVENKNGFGSHEALFQDHCLSVVACGLGGGSLVNAGLMVPTPQRAKRNPKWPKLWQRDCEICEAYASEMLIQFFWRCTHGIRTLVLLDKSLGSHPPD